MNAPEKIAALYLRLNGFFLISNLTVLDGQHHRDIDIVGLRVPDAHELVAGQRLPLDQSFLRHLHPTSLTAAVVQVKGGGTPTFPSDIDVAYVRPLVGAVPITKIAFCLRDGEVTMDNGQVSIGLQYAIRWIDGRIDTMKASASGRLTKLGSWAWSESFLEELLYLTIARAIDAGGGDK